MHSIVRLLQSNEQIKFIQLKSGDPFSSVLKKIKQTTFFNCDN